MNRRPVVVAVLLPREHLPFIRDWCRHHADQGFDVVLYDNTGSVGSRRATCTYHVDRGHPPGHDGRGLPYHSYTSELSDGAVQAVLAQLVRDLPVTIVPWAPTDEVGRVVFDQVEAYVDFIARERDRVEWAAFIDADEYLRAAPGCSWPDLMSAAADDGCSRVVLTAVEYQSRWTPDGRPRDIGRAACLGEQQDGWKNLVRLADVERADIHYAWTMAGGDRCAWPDPRQFWFDHYRGGSGSVRPRLTVTDQPLRTHTDESVEVPRGPGR